MLDFDVRHVILLSGKVLSDVFTAAVHCDKIKPVLATSKAGSPGP